MLQLLEVSQLLPHVIQLLLQLTSYRRARLQPVSAQLQEAANLTEFETQALHAPDKSQRLDITFPVLPEAAPRPERTREQGVALVEANCINAETNPFRNNTDLH